MNDINFEHRLGVLEKQVEKMDGTIKDNSDRCLVLEKSTEQINEKLNGLTKHTDAIVGMSYEVKNLADKVCNAIELIEKQDEKIEAQDSKINCLQDRPGKAAIKMWMFVASAVGTSILGVVIGYFIK